MISCRVYWSGHFRGHVVLLPVPGIWLNLLSNQLESYCFFHRVRGPFLFFEKNIIRLASSLHT